MVWKEKCRSANADGITWMAERMVLNVWYVRIYAIAIIYKMINIIIIYIKSRHIIIIGIYWEYQKFYALVSVLWAIKHKIAPFLRVILSKFIYSQCDLCCQSQQITLSNYNKTIKTEYLQKIWDEDWYGSRSKALILGPRRLEKQIKSKFKLLS